MKVDPVIHKYPSSHDSLCELWVWLPVPWHFSMRVVPSSTQIIYRSVIVMAYQSLMKLWLARLARDSLLRLLLRGAPWSGSFGLVHSVFASHTQAPTSNAIKCTFQFIVWTLELINGSGSHLVEEGGLWSASEAANSTCNDSPLCKNLLMHEMRFMEIHHVS